MGQGGSTHILSSRLALPKLRLPTSVPVKLPTGLALGLVLPREPPASQAGIHTGDTSSQAL